MSDGHCKHSLELRHCTRCLRHVADVAREVLYAYRVRFGGSYGPIDTEIADLDSALNAAARPALSD